MMTDRKLLEKAAKAAGIGHTSFIGGEHYRLLDHWNPLTDDGDALRLLAALPTLWTLKIVFGEIVSMSLAYGAGAGIETQQASHHLGRAWALRRAIVRAAAEMAEGVAQPKPAGGVPEDNYYKDQAEAFYGEAPTDTTSPAEGLGPPPEPAGFRTRYRSEPGMIGHYPWTYADAGRRKGNRPECEYEDLFTADQMRAYALQERAAERERMDRLYEVVSRMVEQDHVVNLTRLHDYCADEPGLSAETVDGGPADAYESSIAAAERERWKAPRQIVIGANRYSIRFTDDGTADVVFVGPNL